MLTSIAGILESAKKNNIYQQLNLNSVTVANKDNVNLGISILNGVRTLEFDLILNANQTVDYNVWSRYTTGVNRFDLSWQSGNKLKTLVSSLFLLSNYVMPLTTKVTVSLRLDITDGARFFYDGVADTINNVSMNTPIPTASINTYIGGLHALPGLGRYSNIKISNVKLWSTSRTDAEILAGLGVYLTGLEAGLIETWHFSNETGDTVTGKNGNTGTITTLNAGGLSHINNTIREII